MLGAIAGDIIGSVYEFSSLKSTDFPLFKPESHFTDDSVMTCAVASALMQENGHRPEVMAESLRKYGRQFINAGYGSSFYYWLMDSMAEPYGSYGNGAAMRASSAGWLACSLEEAEFFAQSSVAVSHNHPESVRAAKSVAGGIFLLRTKHDKNAALKYFDENLGYDLSQSVDEIRPKYSFDESCQGSVPQALRCFLEAETFEQAVRLAISLGGDADTQACIAGALAESMYGMPEEIAWEAYVRIPQMLRTVVNKFAEHVKNSLGEKCPEHFLIV